MEIKDSEGVIAHNFQDKAKAAVKHFQTKFSALVGCPISDILDVLTLFPPLITEGMKKELLDEVSGEGVKQGITLFLER